MTTLLTVLVVLLTFCGSLGVVVYVIMQLVRDQQRDHLNTQKRMMEMQQTALREMQERYGKQTEDWGSSLVEAISSTTRAVAHEVYGERGQVEQPENDETPPQPYFRGAEDVGADPTDYQFDDPVAWDAESRVASIRPGEDPLAFMRGDQAGEEFEGG